MEALLVDNLISEWLDYLTKTCRFHKTLSQLIPKQTLYFYIPMPLAVPDSFWIYSLVISFALGSFKPTAEMKSHLPLNFVFQFKSASNQCSSQWIYFQCFFVFFIHKHIPLHFNSHERWHCACILGVSAYESFHCSCKPLLHRIPCFFFWILLIIKFLFLLFSLFVIPFISIKKTTLFSLGTSSLQKLGFTFFLKDRYHMYYSSYTSQIKLR